MMQAFYVVSALHHCLLSTYSTGPELNPGNIGGRQAFSPLCPPGSPSAKSEWLDIGIDQAHLLVCQCVWVHNYTNINDREQ